MYRPELLSFPVLRLTGGTVFLSLSVCGEGYLLPSERTLLLEGLLDGPRAKCAVLQAVIMPNHLHALLRRTEIHALSELEHQIRAVLEISLAPQELLWEPSAQLRVICGQRDFKIAYRYIRLNPVRAGLARSASSYPWYYESPNLVGVSPLKKGEARSDAKPSG